MRCVDVWIVSEILPQAGKFFLFFWWFQKSTSAFVMLTSFVLCDHYAFRASQQFLVKRISESSSVNNIGKISKHSRYFFKLCLMQFNVCVLLQKFPILDFSRKTQFNRCYWHMTRPFLEKRFPIFSEPTPRLTSMGYAQTCPNLSIIFVFYFQK
jgi:hypothetical protein